MTIPSFLPQTAAGTKTCQVPSTPACNHAGSQVDDYSNQHIGQVHIIPPSTNLGLVPRAGSTFDFQLYNASPDAVSITDITESLTDGITINLISGQELPPLSYTDAIAEISAEGEEEFDSRFTFVFTSPSSPATLRLYGTREPLYELWPWKWNWDASIDSYTTYQTEILKSWGGQEQRICVKDIPDQVYSAEFLVSNSELERALNLSAGWSHRNFFMPVWHRRSYLAEDGVAGGDVIVLEDAKKLRAVVEQRIKIGDQNYKINAINGNEITLNKTIEEDIPSGTEVVVLNVARFDMQPEFGHYTPGISSIKVAFMEDEQKNLDHDFGEYVFDEIDGTPVFPIRPDLSVQPTTSFEIDTDGFMGDSGFAEIVYKNEKAYRIARRDYTLVDDEPWKLMDFYDQRSGRQGHFWVDLGYQELSLVDDIAAGAQLVTVIDNGFYDLLSGKSEEDKVIVRFTDHSYTTFDILSAAQNDGVVELETSAVGEAVELGKVESVGLMRLCRFGDDSLQLRWVTDRIAQTTLSFVSLIGEEE